MTGWDTLRTENKSEEHKKKSNTTPVESKVTVIATYGTPDIVTSVVLSIFTVRTYNTVQTKRITAKLFRI